MHSLVFYSSILIRLFHLIFSAFKILLTCASKLYGTKVNIHTAYEAKLVKKAILKPNTMNPPVSLPYNLNFNALNFVQCGV